MSYNILTAGKLNKLNYYLNICVMKKIFGTERCCCKHSLPKDYNSKEVRKVMRLCALGMVTDDDFTISGVDYSKDKIQTSNLTSLDDAIIKREEEIKRLEYEINIVEALLDSLDSRKDNQYRQLVENYYIENKTYTEVMPIINIYNRYHYFELCKKVLNEFLELI